MAKKSTAERSVRPATKADPDERIVWTKVALARKTLRALKALAGYRGVSPGSIIQTALTQSTGPLYGFSLTTRDADDPRGPKPTIAIDRSTVPPPPTSLSPAGETSSDDREPAA